MKFAIIAAGEGSRLSQEGIVMPKPLVRIGGEPMDAATDYVCDYCGKRFRAEMRFEVETAPDDFGDVELPAPEPEEPALDPRASFPGMAKADTTLTAAHAASEAGDTFREGQSNGNTDRGRTDGRPNAHIKGRHVDGYIKLPEYNVQESGTVVVDIWVDNYGKVVRAVPGGEGTTVMDKTLLAAARSAALETHFNQSTDAPAMQQGTITYYFNLK